MFQVGGGGGGGSLLTYPKTFEIGVSKGTSYSGGRDTEDVTIPAKRF